MLPWAPGPMSFSVDAVLSVSPSLQVTWECYPGVRWRASTVRRAAFRSSCSSSTCKATSPSTANPKSMGPPAPMPRWAGEEPMGMLLREPVLALLVERDNRKVLCRSSLSCLVDRNIQMNLQALCVCLTFSALGIGCACCVPR